MKIRIAPKSVFDVEKEIRAIFSAELPEPRLSGARGKFNAKVLAIAPPPTFEEYEQGLPLTGCGGRLFHEAMLEYAEVDTENDWLVLSCTTHKAGKKKEGVTKQSCAPILDFVQRAAKAGAFRRYVSIGGVAFSEIFNHGKKSSVYPFFGHCVKMPMFNYSEVIVLPDIELMHIPEPERSLWGRKDESIFNNRFMQFQKLLVKMKGRLK